ncbi:putative glycosyl transferase [Tritonibacter multivorans]|uniref:Putative glycosyl transferase n=1 Tax=Tritonibacter multivorans TaxID=928856 RepID=A0A0P1G2K0_9RHOB|nr:glycosyltransferase [Tritonibacter multivorans]MDA7419621.1 glycosyltransferase [Tritonibacter multivorans]CUH75842.1 putative glycosyl transferase [Tritonibacter multivorans]SFC60110.1 Predicted glycosyl transferase [Tritonibacter multivorans]
MKVLIVVTHLLGTGHLSRGLTLGRAFAQAGHQVTLASGGFPAPQLNTDGVELVQLPPLRSDGVDFSRLLTAEGTVADQDYLTHRQSALLGLLDQIQPDVLLTELFPFGRRSLRAEFRALLEAAHALPKRPLILSSIRDILAPPSKPKKAEQAEALISQFYDGVLVHSDPATTTLDASWPVTPALAEKLIYTGYVAPPAAIPHPDNLGAGEILVSAGGGDVGDALFACAIEAAKQMPDHRVRLLVGGRDAQARIARLADPSSPAVLEPARPDFRQMLPHAAASVSMCGYNTALDLLQAGTPSVFVPFDAGNEVEQGLRARSLAELPGFVVSPAAALTPDRLCEAITSAMRQPQRDVHNFRFDGATQSVEIAEKRMKDRQ